MKPWLTPAAIVLLAALLRIAAIVHVDAAHHVTGENRQIALHLAGGHGFSFLAFSHFGPTSVRPPIFPYVLAGLYSIFGIDSGGAHVAALAINVVCGAAATLLVLRLTGRWWAGLLFAIWPTQLFAATQLQGLSLAVCVLLIALLLLQRVRPISAGAVGAMAMLTESILVLPLVAITIFVLRRRPAELVVCLLAMATLTLPWVYRNTLVHGRATLITDNLGPDVFLGNGPDATGSQHLRLRDFAGERLSQIDRLSPPQYDQLKRQPEAARNALMLNWSVDWITTHPAVYAKLCITRTAKTLWLDWDHPKAMNVLNVLARSIGLLLVIGAIIGTCRPTGRDAWRVGLIVMTGAFVLAATFTFAEARNAVLIDVAQLLLLGAIADKDRAGPVLGAAHPS